MPIAPPTLVVGAPRLPLAFGLFSAFTLRPVIEHWEAGVQFETVTCAPAAGIGAPADWSGGTAPIGLPKDLTKNTGAWGASTPFTVYGHFSCSPAGFTPSTAQDRAEVHLLTREEARVEQAFWTSDLGNAPSLKAAGVTVVQAAAGSAVVGLGALENFVAASYGSTGVIHLTRGTALSLLALRALETVGGRLVTRLGTPVVAGAGYPGTGPTGQVAVAGTAWAFATPALFGYRSDVFTSSAHAGDLFDRSQNNLRAVAERTYLLGFDPCGVAAALLTL